MPVGNSGNQIARKGFVVADAGFLEQRRIGRESRDPRLLRHFDDLGLVRTIGKKLDLQIGELRHDSRFLSTLCVGFFGEAIASYGRFIYRTGAG